MTIRKEECDYLAVTMRKRKPNSITMKKEEKGSNG
jgi:hypothetical protein